MAFLKRLGFYLVGLSIGIVFLTLFLKKKSEETGTEFCYFPNCRTLKDLRSKPLVHAKKINRLLLEKKLDTADIAFFLREGEVDFQKSDTKSAPCRTYFVEELLNEKMAIMKFRNCPEKVILEDFYSE